MTADVEGDHLLFTTGFALLRFIVCLSFGKCEVILLHHSLLRLQKIRGTKTKK